MPFVRACSWKAKHRRLTIKEEAKGFHETRTPAIAFGLPALRAASLTSLPRTNGRSPNIAGAGQGAGASARLWPERAHAEGGRQRGRAAAKTRRNGGFHLVPHDGTGATFLGVPPVCALPLWDPSAAPRPQLDCDPFHLRPPVRDVLRHPPPEPAAGACPPGMLLPRGRRQDADVRWR